MARRRNAEVKTAVGDENKEERNDIMIDKTYPAGVDQGPWLRLDDINARGCECGWVWM